MSGTEKRTRVAMGKVVSNKMDKTITVLVERRVRHPVYGKYITRSSRIHAHDESNQCSVGDTVTVAESRPISRTKSWKLLEIIESAIPV
ncbi:MAG: 30S ribosomal protein S17 [Halioglobus sp.]|nr:30S ribosomal protein S17 [Halioglobus sp.]